MEIQQKEKEFLAAYIHQFKREANRCNFDNNAATIWIFIKGLRNVHTLATRVYKKGGTTKLGRCHQGSREAPSSTTVNHCTTALIHSKCHVE